MEYIKVKDKNYLIRNSDTNAIINTDIKGYEDYENQYKRLYDQNKRIESVEKNVNEIKSDLTEIKNLLRNLTNGS